MVSKRCALVDDWNAVLKFYADCEEAAGDTLILKMQETIVQCTRAVKFVGTGNFLENEDLSAKYAAKLAQLNAIK